MSRKRGVINNAPSPAVTQQRQSKEALEESAEKYKSLVNNINMGIFRSTPGPRGRFLEVNPAHEKITGYSREELLKMDVSKLYVHPEEREAHVERAILAKDKTSEELRFKKKDGTEITVLDTMTVVRDNAGRALYLDGITEDITEHKRAREELQESEEKFRDLAELLPETVFEVDAEANITFVNRNAFNNFGYSQEDFNAGVNALQMLIPEERDRAGENIRRVLSGEELGGIEYTALRKEGSTFPIVIYSSPVTRKSKTVGFRGILIDITEHKQAELEIKGLKEKYETLIKNIPCAVYSSLPDRLSTTTFVSNRYENWTGYSPEDFYRDPETWLKSIHPEDRERAAKAYSKAYTSKGEYAFAYRIVHRDTGQVYYVRDHGIPIKDEEGNVTSLEGIITDITERKRLEEALKESEKKFRTFMETASDLMNITDKDGNFTYVNDSMAKTLGYSKEELIGMHITQILTKEALEKDFKPNWDKFITNGEISFETTFLTKEGGEIRCEMKAVTIYDSNGNHVGTRAVHRDITERKQAEQELQEKNEQLDAQNEELKAQSEELMAQQ